MVELEKSLSCLEFGCGYLDFIVDCIYMCYELFSRFLFNILFCGLDRIRVMNMDYRLVRFFLFCTLIY